VFLGTSWSRFRVPLAKVARREGGPANDVSLSPYSEDYAVYMDDDAIRLLVTNLSRPHRSGGDVIERAAIMATGSQSSQVVTWIVAHNGEPEAAVEAASSRGLHGTRFSGSTGSDRPPLRYVLPPGTLRT
jgi:hypothetical protein